MRVHLGLRAAGEGQMADSAPATSSQRQSALAHHCIGMRRAGAPGAPSPSRLLLACAAFSNLLLCIQADTTSSNFMPSQHTQLYVVCKDLDSQVCLSWRVATETIDEMLKELTPWREFSTYCGLSDLKFLPSHRRFIAVKPFNESQKKRMTFCKSLSVMSEDAFNLANMPGAIKVVHRQRRQSGYIPRGRYRGQTQSQYLAIDGGNGKDEGKAEAHSAADSSRASVSGNSGMGQAQSQTIYDPSCEECLGRSDLEAANLSRKPQNGAGNGQANFPQYHGGQGTLDGTTAGRPGTWGSQGNVPHSGNGRYDSGQGGINGKTVPIQGRPDDNFNKGGGRIDVPFGPHKDGFGTGTYPTSISGTGDVGSFPGQKSTNYYSREQPGITGGNQGSNQVGMRGGTTYPLNNGYFMQTRPEYGNQNGKPDRSYDAGQIMPNQNGISGVQPTQNTAGMTGPPTKPFYTSSQGGIPNNVMGPPRIMSEGSMVPQGLAGPNGIQTTFANGQAPSGANWPSSGFVRGADGLLYFCCVVKPDQQQYLQPSGWAGGPQRNGGGGSYITGTGGQQIPSGSFIPGTAGQQVPSGTYLPGTGGQQTGGGMYIPGTGGQQTPSGPYVPGAGGQRTGGGSYMPGTGGQQTPSGTYMPGTGGQQTGGGSYIPGTGGQQIPSGTYMPGAGGQQTGGGSFIPGTGGQQTPSGTYIPSTGGQQSGGGSYMPGTGGQQTPSGTYMPGTSGQQTGGGTYIPGAGGQQLPGGTYMPGTGGQQTGGGSYIPGTGGQQTPSGTFMPATGGQQTGGSFVPGIGGQQTGGGSYVPGIGGQQTPSGSYMPSTVGGGSYIPSTEGQQTGGGTFIPGTGGQQAPSGLYTPGAGGLQTGGGSYAPGGQQTGGGTYTPGTGGQQAPSGLYGPGTGGQQTGGGSYVTGAGGQQAGGGLYLPSTGGQQTPSGTYIPGTGGGSYIPDTGGQQTPSGSYMPGSGGQQTPSVSYMPRMGGQQTSGGSYIPGTGGQQTPSGSYIPGISGQQTPSGTYTPGAGGQQTGGGSYIPGTGGQQTPSGTYMPGAGGQQTGGGSYIQGTGGQQTPGGTYMPGAGGQQTGGGSYLPGTGGQQTPSGSYTPGIGVQQTPDGAYAQGTGGQTVGGSYVPSTGGQQIPIGSYIPSAGGQQSEGGSAGMGIHGDYGGTGEPQNVLDPNSIITDDDSQALASVYQKSNGTTASASSSGGNDKGRAKTNVQGSYTDTGEFSAQASISDDNKGAESQVSGSKKGATSNAEGRGRKNKSQAAVKLGSETGSIQTDSQSSGIMHSSNTQVQGSVKGGVADAQARGPGSTSSQAQIGFTPYKQGDKAHELLKKPFEGGGTASAQSSGRLGTSQSQLRGTFKYGISYNGAAQAGASLDKDAVFSNLLPFEKIDVFDQNNTNINVDIQNTENPPIEASPTDIPIDTDIVTKKEEEIIKDSEDQFSDHTHLDHHKNNYEPNTSSVPPLASNRRAFPSAYGNNNGADYDYNIDDNPTEEYDMDDVSDGTDNVPVEQGEYTNYDNYARETEDTHQAQRSSSRKGLEVRQTTGGNTQHILIGSLKNQDAKITQIKSERPDESRVYQPGERVPGMGGYTIPVGFTGSVKSVASKEKTYVIGSRNSPSQAQTVTLTPGTGRVKYVNPERYSKNVHSKDLRSLYNPRPDDNRYVSVSKSVTRDLDSENNIRKQYSHTYYTKSSSCGYFTFTCTMVSSAEGKKKVCKPKIPTNPDGSPMRC